MLYLYVLEMLGVLYYGRLEKEKGFDALLEAIRILDKQNSDEPAYEFFIF
jgi:glycosyltransferase involved in cell wall biosynthesis